MRHVARTSRLPVASCSRWGALGANRFGFSRSIDIILISVSPLHERYFFGAADTLENDMSNLAAVLKKEISRLARKEVRAAADSTKKANAKLRDEIASLKKRVKELETRLASIEPRGVACLLYTSPSPRDATLSRMPSSA